MHAQTIPHGDPEEELPPPPAAPDPDTLDPEGPPAISEPVLDPND